MSLPYERRNIRLAKALRKNATPEENKLWYHFLRNYPLRFQRQKCIDQYIADFYCKKAELIIELDGSEHYTPEGITHDSLRAQVLETYHLVILRFTNQDIADSFSAVCQQIDDAVKDRINNE